ncbi:MAG: shikimate dehydrogenase [Saprospiraceae bacterium]
MDVKQVKKLYGLIGYPLSHSFSKRYFAEKFEKEHIGDSFYELFPIASIKDLPQLIADHPNLVGLNVTIPYKEQILPFLDEIEEGAAAAGAVNTVLLKNGQKKGYNSDVYGFIKSLENAMDQSRQSISKALILGTGGAAKAVKYALERKGINTLYVSRTKGPGQLSYTDLTKDIVETHSLIVNTSPLGMAPKVDTFPNIPYHYIGENHLCFDLVYNPTMTLFLQKSQEQGAHTLNGLEMLYLQAEKSWEIWTTN